MTEDARNSIVAWGVVILISVAIYVGLTSGAIDLIPEWVGRYGLLFASIPLIVRALDWCVKRMKRTESKVER